MSELKQTNSQSSIHPDDDDSEVKKEENVNKRVARQHNALNNTVIMKRGGFDTELQFLYGIILVWVSELQACPDFLNRWRLVNQYLIRIQAPCFDDLDRIAPVIAEVEAEFLVFAVSSILWNALASPILVGVGIPKRIELDRLLRAVSALESVDTLRSIESANQWRSNTFRALSTFNEYSAQLEVEWRKATKLVFAMLRVSGFTGVDISKGKMQSFEDTIAAPYARLVSEIQCAPQKYRWSWECPYQSLEKQHLRILEILDPRSEFTVLRPWLCNSETPEKHNIGESYFALFPTLWKVDAGKDDEGRTVCTETIGSKGWAVAKMHGAYPGLCDSDLGGGKVSTPAENPENGEDERYTETIAEYMKKGREAVMADVAGEDRHLEVQQRLSTEEYLEQEFLEETGLSSADFGAEMPDYGYLAYLEGPDGQEFPMFVE